MKNIEVLDNFFSRYKIRTMLPSREEILLGMLRYECYSDNSIYSLDSSSDNRKNMVYTTVDNDTAKDIIKSVPRLRISLCIPTKKKKDAIIGLLGLSENEDTSFVVLANNKFSLNNTDLYFNDFHSFLNAYRYIRKFSGTNKYSNKKDPFSLKINGVPCSIDFGMSENEYFDIYSSYIRLYLRKKLNDGNIDNVCGEEFKQFLVTFVSLNTFDSSSYNYLSKLLGLNINQSNVDKVRFVTEEIIHTFESEYSIDSLKKLFIKSKYLLGKGVDFYDELDNSLKRLISYDEKTGTYDRNQLSWLSKQLEFQMDIIQSSRFKKQKESGIIIQEDEFFPQLGAILLGNKQTLLRYVNSFRRVDSIKARIINSFNENRSFLDEEKSFGEFVSNFSDEELLLIRSKMGYSSDFPSSREQFEKILKSYSAHVIADYKAKKDTNVIKK